MKKLGLTTVIGVFCMIISIGVQAQTSQTKLNQIELVKQAIGIWQNEAGKDSILIAEVQQFGNAFTETLYLMVDGRKSVVNLWAFGYSPKEDKFKLFSVRPDGNYSTYVASFISKNKWTGNRVQDFNPEKAFEKFEILYDTPTNFTETWFNSDGVKTSERKWTKVK